MYSRGTKRTVFLLEALNALATTLFFFYIFFFMAARYQFGSRENLLLASVNGLFYAGWSLLGGRVGQKFGYLVACVFGFAVMSGSLLVGVFCHSLWPHLFVIWTCNFGMCFTWPNLEAMISEGETAKDLPRMLGIYNLIWAGAGALAYFIGGAMIEKLGLRSMFVVPASIQIIQILVALQLRMRLPKSIRAVPAPAIIADLETEHAPPVLREQFLRLAWIVNPLAYVTINSAVPVIPALSKKLQLSPAWAGVFCSTWFFARTAGFLLCWRWTGWHYRFGWLLTAFLTVATSFVLIQMATSLWFVVAAQITFGLGLALIYYSSLYYAMHASDEKGAHGGIHESIIGLGNCMGPGLGALALYLYPQARSANVIAVAILLLCGLGWILKTRAAHVRTGAGGKTTLDTNSSRT